ncbi:MAG: mechanosensitive ion channel [Gammaproteobacteria bacterium]|nr:mechanosensitive ion channel [Gammaproteobacteria bacterium]
MPFDLPNDIGTLLETWLGQPRSPDFWWQIGVLLLAAAGALLVHRALSQSLDQQSEGSLENPLRRLTLKSLQRLLFPISMLLGVLAGRALLVSMEQQVELLNLAVPLLTSLASIRIAVYFLRKTFQPGPAVKAWEGLISTSAWIIVALHLLGWLPTVLEALDAIALQVGTVRISLLETIKLVLAVALTWILALWLARMIELRLSRTDYVNPGMQVALVKLSKFALLTLASLLALEAAGIDLTALAVFGGALGVGLGFGLQRIASNFISGFIVLFDRSIRPGDVITIGDKFGWVQELRARYIVVRDRDGVERLIPNETLITNEVINWSYTDCNVRLKIPVSISYNNDPEQAMALLQQAVIGVPRVLADPAPAARLLAFGDNGIELELRIWINDPQQGLMGVRSDVYVQIWRLFKAAGIVIPFPQRDLHLLGPWPGKPQDGSTDTPHVGTERDQQDLSL